MRLKILPFGKTHAVLCSSLVFLDAGQRNSQNPKWQIEGEVQEHMNGRSSARRKPNNGNVLRGEQESSGRAQRFPIHVPIRYRKPHTPDWLVASTENVSRSGVLFRPECDFEPTTALDLRLELPPINNADGVHGEIVCKGEVVRVEQTHPLGVSPAVAVAIHYYRLARKREPN